MKKSLTLLSLLVGVSLFSQVGINTNEPKATLDVVASATDISKIDGIIAPRVTRAELTNKGNSLYGANQKGTLLYVTDISGGNSSDQRVNITSVGYYYFDGSVWQKITAGDDTSIYTNDGKLTANRTVTMDGKNLSFTGDGNVGIGINAPSTKLDITSSTNGAIKIADGTQQLGYVLTSDENGVGTWKPAGATATIIATFPSTPTLVSSSSSSYTSTTLYIDLPKGKWLVSANLLIGNTSSNYKWNGFALSSNNTGAAPSQTGWKYMNTSLAGHTFKNALLPKLSGSPSPTSGPSLGNGTYNMVSGSQLIEVTAATVRIYFVLDNVADLTFLTSAWENNIYAIPIY